MTANPIAIYYRHKRLDHDVTSVVSARWLINQDCNPISAKDVVKLTRSGKLPQTKKIMEVEKLDFRSPFVWVKAYEELKDFPLLDLYTLSNFADSLKD